MIFRSRETLESWIEEFRQLGYPVGAVRVMPQDPAGGADTGLVGVHLSDAATPVYIQPEGAGSKRWMVTFEPREEIAVIGSAETMRMSTELAMVAALCAFLQARAGSVADCDDRES